MVGKSGLLGRFEVGDDEYTWLISIVILRVNLSAL